MLQLPGCRPGAGVGEVWIKEGGKGPRLCHSYLLTGLAQVWGRWQVV